MNKLLASIYYDTSNPGAYSSVNKLYRAAKIKNPNIRLKDVKNWLEGELTYTLHFPRRTHFKRNKILVEHVDEQWESDLVDMQEFSKYNEGHKYIITIIDVLSKYAWAIAIKDKRGNTVMNSFEKVFKERMPQYIRTDRGTEYLNKNVLAYFKELGVKHFTSKNDDIKCAIVERFNRTLKGKMFKYFTYSGKHRYIDELKNLVDSYNNSIHRSIKMKPIDVNSQNEKKAFKNLYGVETYRDAIRERNVKPKHIEGDKIRLKYKNDPFYKGFYPNWTDHIYTITKVINANEKPYYHIKDYSGKELKRRFYPEEVQKVIENLHRIEKVIKTRKRKGKTEYFVKWLHYPDSYNSWITELIQLS